MFRLCCALAVIAVALVAGCRDRLPTERAIQVHSPAAHICYTDRTGPLSCDCAQYMYDHPGDPPPSICWPSSAQVVLWSDHGPRPSISVNSGDTVMFGVYTDSASTVLSVTGYSFVPLPPIAMARRIPGRGGVLPAIRAAPARVGSAASVTRGRSAGLVPGRSMQMIPGVPSCRTSTATTCFDVFTTSGYEIVSATVDGVAERDSILVTVVVPIPDDSFAVVCVPGTATRGSAVQCSGRFGRPRAFTVMAHVATSTGFNLQMRDSVTVPVDSTQFSWSGVAAASTAVTMRVQYRDSANHLHKGIVGKGSFSVVPRAASDPVLRAPREVRDSLVFDMTDYPYRAVIDHPNQLAATWGTYLSSLGEGGTSILTFDVSGAANSLSTIQDGGPNNGLAYWIQWPTIADSSISYIHPGLSGGLGYPGATRWYGQQTGPEPAKCSQSIGIATLFSETERHEGATHVTDSHYGVLVNLVQSESLAVHLERMTARDSIKLKTATQAYIDKINKRHKTLQTQYDDVDKPLIWGQQTPRSTDLGRINCHIVFAMP